MGKWLEDKTEEVVRKATSTLRTGQASSKSKNLAHLVKSESLRSITAMIKLGQSREGIAVYPGQFDRDPYLFNCRNGTIELKVGVFRSARRSDLITKTSGVSYAPQARCPLWQGFLGTVMGSDTELIAFLQRLVGYLLTGTTKEQAIFFFHGLGANGKTTFIEVVCELLSDYAVRTPMETLLIKRNETVPADIARLCGARLVAASEIAAGRRLDEATVKQLTGSDRIVARRLYQDFFEFDPTHKIVVAVNHKPTIKGSDNGIWRRVILVPWNVTIPSEEQDKDLLEKLKGELPGILNWALEGFRHWQESGLKPPKTVTDATSEYRAEQDLLADFLEQCCVCVPTGSAGATSLYKAWTAWCEVNGMKTGSQKALGQELRARGFEHDKKGTVKYRGLTLLKQADAIQMESRNEYRQPE